MPDPNETEQTQEVQETEEVKTEETQTEQTEEPTTEKTKEEEEETGAGLIARVKAKVFGDRAEAKTEQGAEIPDEFTEAARKLNWSDEATTKFAANYSNDQLKEMIPELLGEDTAKADDTSDKAGEEAKPEAEEEKGEDSQEDERLTEALDRIAELEKDRDSRNETSKEEEQDSFVGKACDAFDKASEEFEVFGKTEDLPRFPDGRLIKTSPQMQARNEVFSNAQVLKEAGMPGDKALEFSLNAYKGANLATETKRSVIKGLKDREQTLGGKRIGHRATEAVELNPEETIEAIRRRHGK
ncbi:MAG: hypothetical protein GY938_30860 [Ketobacter sp.]|nr:hypothetical protein [Ketobacter sp.]